MDEGSELEPAVTELAETLEELRTELTAPPEGAFGLPRPPSPRELLRLTEQYTIPAVIAVLETNIRVLELLAAAIRVADGRPLDAAAREEGLLAAGGRGLADAGRHGADGLAAASRATLQQLDDALAELQAAAEGGSPDDPDLQRLLTEARSLRAEVDEQLAAAGDEDPNAADTAGADAEDAGGPTKSPAPGADAPVDIDVEEELDTLRRQADRPDSDDGGDPGDGGDPDDGE